MVISIFPEGQELIGKGYRLIKRVIDFIISLLSLIFLSPLFLTLMALIKMTSPGPSIFSHRRVGMNGKLFTLYKFRTMDITTPKYIPKPKEDDRRITKFGRFLRKSGLDELPQLYNVLKGQMSLVGPRPEMPFIAERYTEKEKERLRAKPGITGLWQLSGKTTAPIHDNLEYDLSYIKNQSFILDLKILLKTLIFLIGNLGISNYIDV